MIYHSETFCIENASIYVTINYTKTLYQKDAKQIALYVSVDKNSLLLHHKITFIDEKVLNYMHTYDSNVLFGTIIKKYFEARESTKNFENMFENEILNLFRDIKLISNVNFIEILKTNLLNLKNKLS